MKVAVYCGEYFMPWGPRSVENGIGGSEEAVIHLTRELALLGCEVTVYGDPPPGESGVHDGVLWRSWREFDRDAAGDVFIAWRNAANVLLGTRWRQVHHWCHDRQNYDYPLEAAPYVDRVLVVSRHHATDRGFDAVREKIVVTSNGLDPGFLREAGHNEPDRAIYASCPARGLGYVLRMWPAIKRAVPTAKLDVYHGFTPVYEAMTRMYPGLDQIRRDVQRLLDGDGITVHGMVGHAQLSEAFARAGVWLYPTETAETSCITAMKALAMGCLPVTSGIAALGETLGGRDFGPVHPTKPIGSSWWRMRSFRRRAVWAMKHGGSPAMRTTRLDFARWARTRYSWRAIARQWLELFHAVDAQKVRRGTAA